MPGRLLSGTRLWSGGEKPAGFSRVLCRELSGEGKQNSATTRPAQRTTSPSAVRRGVMRKEKGVSGLGSKLKRG